MHPALHSVDKKVSVSNALKTEKHENDAETLGCALQTEATDMLYCCSS